MTHVNTLNKCNKLFSECKTIVCTIKFYWVWLVLCLFFMLVNFYKAFSTKQ